MENIKFSIIIPAYNSEKFIGECLNSIFSQTYKNVEIIVVNDCSTDNTLKVLERYEQIKVFSTLVNSRQGVARNIGLQHSTGDYVLFVDSDDTLYDSEVLSQIADKINNTNYPDLMYLGLKMEGRRELELIPNEENTKKEYRLAENPFINVTSICWKNSLIQENNIRFPEKIRYEDVYFAFLGIEKAKTYEYMDIIYYLANNRDDSTTTNYTIAQARDTVSLIEKLFELYDIIDEENKPYLKKRIEQQSERAKVRLERALNSMFEKKTNNKVPDNNAEGR